MTAIVVTHQSISSPSLCSFAHKRSDGRKLTIT